MTQIETLLKQISEIVAKEKTQQEEKRKRGENFNIFDVLGLSTSEVRLYSAFLAELLNPNGNHGLCDKFLQAFIDDVVLKKQEVFSFDPQSAKVFVEYDIGEISQNYDKGGRIDLMIQDKNRQTIVIENKIYAGDQKLQLYRYNHYIQETAKLKDSQYVLLYLTLEGDKPSEFSTGKKIFNYSCVNYREDILPWLGKCIGIAALFPRVRETIAQYKLNLEDILNIMSETNKQELLHLMTSHAREVDALIMAQDDYRKYVFETFVLPKFKDFAQQKNLLCVTHNLFGSRKGGRGVFFYRNDWKSMAICLWSDRTGEWEFYMGISNYTDCDMSQFPKIKLDCFDRSPNDTWPNGWKLLDKYSNWSFASGTLTAMIEGDFAKYVIKQIEIILDEIDRNNIKMN